MANFGLVIFDCDGVLVDSETIAVRMDRLVLADLGWNLSEAEIVERFVGRSESHFVSRVEEHLGITLAAGWDSKYRTWYRDAFNAGLKPVEGIVEALNGVDENLGLPCCVASSGSHGKMRRTLGQTGLYERFDGRIFSAVEVDRGKPAPDLFLHAARSLGFPPENCAVVEDSAAGVAAARSAGMQVFAYGAGVTPVERLTGPGTVVFHRMQDLPSLLSAGTPPTSGTGTPPTSGTGTPPVSGRGMPPAGVPTGRAGVR